MIETFRVQNYKALRDVELKLTPMHVLIGPNDSGKTSILEALGALCRSVDEPLQKAFAGSWSGRELVTRGGTSVLLEATFDSGVGTYQMKCAFPEPPSRVVNVLSESVDGHPFSNAPHEQETTVWRQKGVKDSSKTAEWCRVIAAKLSGVQYCRWNARSLALPNAQDAQRRLRLDSSGFGLALFIDDILGMDRALFTKMEDRFRNIFPDIGCIKLIRQRAFRSPLDSAQGLPFLQEADGKGLFFEFRNGLTVPASQISDGILLVLAYLVVLYSPEKPRLLMVEEPENGIHPSRLKEVLRILRELVDEQSHTQVVMTTHSPYVLDEFKPEEVTICRKGSNGEVSVRRLDSVQSVREQLNVFSLGEIWTAEGDEALARGDSNGAGGKQ